MHVGPFLPLTRRGPVASAFLSSATSPVGSVIDRLGEQYTEGLQEWDGKLFGELGCVDCPSRIMPQDP